MESKPDTKDALEAIKKTINKKAILEKIDMKLKLNEDSKGASLKSVLISGFDEAVGINHDNCCLISDKITTKGARKTCDGIIFFRLENKHYILITDLKSSLSNIEDHAFKTKSGKNFVSYLSCLLNQFEEVDISNWEIYYCIFIDEDKYSNQRRPTAAAPESANKSPCNPARIPIKNNSTVSVRKLLNIRI